MNIFKKNDERIRTIKGKLAGKKIHIGKRITNVKEVRSNE